MDTTDEYIKMCCKSEIQKLWVFKDGDYICDAEMLNESFVDVWSGYDAWDYPCYPVDGIWLPCQDQLQDMIKMDFPYVCWEFYHSIAIGGNTERFHSYEQLWLVFVMQKLYKKRWNGSEWDEI